MKSIFSPEEESAALQLLESIQTAREAVDIMIRLLNGSDMASFSQVAGTLAELLDRIHQASIPYHKKLDTIILPTTCECALYSLGVICDALPANLEKAIMKLRYELAPILEEAYMQFYYWAYVHSHPTREAEYYQQEMFELASNPYVNVALETGKYKYDVAFMITGYNHLDYTKMCVESLLNNIPSDLNYELILFDHGSTDGTEAFFESVHPTKLIKSKINYGIGGAPVRAVEAKYLFGISNDVIILPGAIDNALECIQSANNIARVVPSTPNVSNLQTISANYSSMQDLEEFARKNNISDPYRWEQRTRLCDPVSISNMLLCYSRQGVCSHGYLDRNCNIFPDDRIALLCRRAGYKMYLAKNAYCHHFGSVTLRDEISQYNEQKFYAEGRKKFYDWFGIDPWGTGFCYDPVFSNRVVGEHAGHVEVLGINCGMGSNSLKIKEQIKEYCHNTDCTLTNITDDDRFIFDLKGISDEALFVSRIKEFKALLSNRCFHYIIWDDSFLTQYKFTTLIEICQKSLTLDGVLLMRLKEQSKSKVVQNYFELVKKEGNWLICQHWIV